MRLFVMKVGNKEGIALDEKLLEESEVNENNLVGVVQSFEEAQKVLSANGLTCVAGSRPIILVISEKPTLLGRLSILRCIARMVGKEPNDFILHIMKESPFEFPTLH